MEGNNLNQYLMLSNDRKNIIQQIAFKYCTDSETFRKIYLHCLSNTARGNIDFAISELYKEQFNKLPEKIRKKYEKPCM